MARHKDSNWNIPQEPSYEGARLAVLMDIRDELKAANRTLDSLATLGRCNRIQTMFRTVERLDRRLAKKYPLRGQR